MAKKWFRIMNLTVGNFTEAIYYTTDQIVTGKCAAAKSKIEIVSFIGWHRGIRACLGCRCLKSSDLNSALGPVARLTHKTAKP